VIQRAPRDRSRLDLLHVSGGREACNGWGSPDARGPRRTHLGHSDTTRDRPLPRRHEPIVGDALTSKRDVLICQQINTQWFIQPLPAHSGAYVSGHLLVANTAIERERRFARSAGSSPLCLDRGRVGTASPHPPTSKQSHWPRLHAPRYLAAAFAGRSVGPGARSSLRSSP
jgi:hypothetical protein